MLPRFRSRSRASGGSEGTRRRWRSALAAAVTILVTGGLVVGITTLASAATTWTSVSAGLYHTCGIKSDKTLWCWGRNQRYQLGLGTTGTKTTPQQVGSWKDWKRVEAGFHHTCGIRTNGWLYCWGYNGEYQIGRISVGDVKTPIRVTISGFSDDEQPAWADISPGNMHTCGIAEKVLYCWGGNDVGQLGLGDHRVRKEPIRLDGRWRDVDTGNSHTCAVADAYAMYCWGFDAYGQLGLGDTSPQEVLEPQSQGGAWRSVTAGDDHTCGISRDGQFPYCWGSDRSGQIGNDAPKEGVSTRRRISVNAWSSLDAGGQHTCGVRGDGTRFCWGENGQGQLGLNDTNDRDEPIQRQGEGAWSAVSTGWEHSCGIRSGDLLCWGDNFFGQLGIGSTSRQLLPVKVGS